MIPRLSISTTCCWVISLAFHELENGCWNTGLASPVSISCSALESAKTELNSVTRSFKFCRCVLVTFCAICLSSIVRSIFLSGCGSGTDSPGGSSLFVLSSSRVVTSVAVPITVRSLIYWSCPVVLATRTVVVSCPLIRACPGLTPFLLASCGAGSIIAIGLGLLNLMPKIGIALMEWGGSW